MQRITLVNPPRLDPLTRRTSHTREPHLGLAYIAAVVRAAGHSVHVVDAEAEELNLAQTVHRALAGHPRYVGLTADTTRVKSAAKVAAAIKQLAPGCPVVLGGYHATVLPAQTLEEFPAIDVVVIGEGEQTALDLATSLADVADPADGRWTRALATIPAVAYRRPEGIAVTSSRAAPCDLDDLPFPAWDLFPLERYQAHYRTDHRVLELPVNTGRGCYGRCKFCARVSGEVVRRRSVASVVAEIQQNVDRYGAGAVVFFDETFTADPAFVEALCEALVAAEIPRRLYWLCMTRVDALSPELLRQMARAGCRLVALGVESGNPELLEAASKAMDLDKVHAVVRAAQAVSIQVDTFFVLGLPGETRQTIDRTIAFALDLDPDYATFFTLVPYPGTRYHAMAQRGEAGLHLLTQDWDQYGIQMGRTLALDGLSRTQLGRAQLKAYLRFYLRPSKLGNMLRMVNPRVLPTYLLNQIWPRLAQALRPLGSS